MENKDKRGRSEDEQEGESRGRSRSRSKSRTRAEASREPSLLREERERRTEAMKERLRAKVLAKRALFSTLPGPNSSNNP